MTTTEDGLGPDSSVEAAFGTSRRRRQQKKQKEDTAPTSGPATDERTLHTDPEPTPPTAAPGAVATEQTPTAQATPAAKAPTPSGPPPEPVVPAPAPVQENDEEASTGNTATEVAVRRVEAPAVRRQEHSQEEVDGVARLAESSEPDLVDLTEEDLDELEEQRLDEQDTTLSPFTVDLDGRLKRRLDRVIRNSKRTGRRLTITAVVSQALEQNRRQYGKAVSEWRKKNAPVTDGTLFSPSEGRRWVGRSLDATTATITVRPTLEERVLIERAVLVSGAHTRKELIEAVLDNRLPQLPGRPPKS